MIYISASKINSYFFSYPDPHMVSSIDNKTWYMSYYASKTPTLFSSITASDMFPLSSFFDSCMMYLVCEYLFMYVLFIYFSGIH